MNINEPSHGAGLVLPFFNKDTTQRSARAHPLKSNQLLFLNWIPDSVSSSWSFPTIEVHVQQARNHFVATCAEFAITTLFLFFAFLGTEVALLAIPANSTNTVRTPSDQSQLLYIALSFSFSLVVNT